MNSNAGKAVKDEIQFLPSLSRSEWPRQPVVGTPWLWWLSMWLSVGTRDGPAEPRPCCLFELAEASAPKTSRSETSGVKPLVNWIKF